jgi:hypothetical protein
MPGPDRNKERALRERAYFLWVQEGRPEGRAKTHWERAVEWLGDEPAGHDDEPMSDEEKVLTGRPGVNLPAMLTKDVLGG